MNRHGRVLKVTDLTMRFGGLLAVDKVNLKVDKREIVSIIGPNGAGKTTVFNCLSGFYRPSSGQILFKKHQIAGLADFKISRLGLVRTFQHVRLFANMTVLENMLVAQHRHLNTHLLAGLFKTKNYRKKEQKALERARFWLEEVNLLGAANTLAENLSYGQQRRLEIARAMVTCPKLLLLDEPAAGLNPSETHDLMQLILRLRDDEGIAVVLIEHDMNLVMDVSDYIYVLAQGALLAEGDSVAVKNNPAVIKAYLGEA